MKYVGICWVLFAPMMKKSIVSWLAENLASKKTMQICKLTGDRGF